MKHGISILGGILLAAAISSPALAHGHGGGGGESQAGGLPGLEDRVEVDEGLIATLQSQVLVLQGQVTTLQGQVSTLNTEVSTLQTQVTDLQGQNNWAVVDSTGSPVRSFSGSSGTVTSTKLATGQYEVVFPKDVSACAYQATIGGTGTTAPAQGQISVSGDPDTDSPNDVFVQTFNAAGTTATDSSFHLNVTCP